MYTDTHAWMNRLMRGQEPEEPREEGDIMSTDDASTQSPEPVEGQPVYHGSIDGGERDREPEPGPFNVNEALRAMWLWHRGL